ncbi:neprilysin-2-like [Venturia canescens]|uniref:neprilysin-2-like n=1 Tax=Venturia canescens TaxID=32260 RepID=UPI001C9D1B22|nr:neprilysin-2-like [Venturia canescens]
MNHREGSSSLGNAALTIVCVFLFKVNLARIPQVVKGEQCLHEECLKQGKRSKAPIKNSSLKLDTNELIAANRLSESIDMSVDPCDDFVEFACGKAFANYEKTAAAQSQRGLTPTSHSMQMTWIRQKLIEELNQPYRIEEHRAIGLAKMYWQSCKIVSPAEALAGVRILLKRLGGWPLITKNWQDKHFAWDKFSKCARLLGFLPRMFIHVGLNDENVEKPWYANDSIELTIERAKYMVDRETMNRMFERAEEYFKIAERIAENKNPDMADIDEALQFAKRLHMVTFSTFSRNKITFVNNMPIVELKVMTIAQLQKTFPFVNWMDYIRSMLTRKQANYLSDRNCVIVDVCYMSKIGNILETTEKSVQANYAFLSIVDDLSLFIRPQLSLTFASSQEETENICFDSTLVIFRKSMEMILAKMAGQRIRQKIHEIWMIIYNEAVEMFQKIPWMDHQTQLEAAKKSEKTGYVNLFPDNIFEDRYFDRVSINIPAATVLQDFFSLIPELDFMALASIGLQIANALGYQICRQGSYIDVSGHWREASWWSKTTQRQFASRENCLEIGKVKPIDEISPIFGLIGAAEITYKAIFERFPHARSTVLPGLSYTTKQLFWISAVASDCDRNQKPQYNAMVAHNSNFAQDFSCPKGSKMNPPQKCKMWLP